MAGISDKTKLMEGRCEGEGLDYIPWIKANEIFSQGSSIVTRNFKNGRDVHLLSDGEAKVFFTLLYSDEIIDIKEQYVLDLNDCQRIAKELGYKPPNKRMSTDFYLTLKDSFYDYAAISVKSNPSGLKSRRSRELQKIESKYWDEKGVFYELVFADEIDPIYVKNIRTVTKINKPEDIYDGISAVKFLITHKIITPNMHKELDFAKLYVENKEEVKKLYEVLRRIEKS